MATSIIPGKVFEVIPELETVGFPESPVFVCADTPEEAIQMYCEEWGKCGFPGTVGNMRSVRRVGNGIILRK